jgi:hypothetical protein
MFLMTAAISFGQVSKGRTMITGSFNYNRNPDQGLYNFINFGTVDQTIGYASVGHLLRPRFAMGIDLTVDYRFLELDQSSFGSVSRMVENHSVVTPGIFARTYIPLSEKFAAFIEGGYGLGFGNTNRTMYSDGTFPTETLESTSKTNSIRLKAGLNYFITGRFALECSPGVITWSNVNPNYGESTKGLNAAIGLKNLTFGLVIFLGGAE